MDSLRKVLSSAGIGSAKVETVVRSARIYPGQELSGFVVMQGGDAEQTIESVHLELSTSYLHGSGDSAHQQTYVLTETGIYQPFTLGRKQMREFPFAIPIPFDCPVSLHRSRIWLSTRMTIPWSVDPGDVDPLEVLPLPTVAMVLEAMTLLGFHLREVQCEYDRRFSRDRPFVQDFEFAPRGGPYQGRLDEVELYFFPDRDYLGLILQIDRRRHLFSGSHGSDERHLSLTLEPAHFAHGSHGVAGMLDPLIAQRC